MGSRVVRYSEAFKRQVVSELESGRVANQAEARRKFGIAGKSTVYGWLRKYGKNHLVGKVVRVQMATERDEVKELRKELREAKKALAEETLRRHLTEGYLEIACERAGERDVEAFKKKHEKKR